MQVFKGRAFMAEGEALGWETIWSGRGTMWGMVGMERTGKATEVQEEEWEVEIKEGRVVEEMFSLNRFPTGYHKDCGFILSEVCSRGF